MSPQPSSFVGYIENYGIKLWRPFKQQYSMGRNGHRPCSLVQKIKSGNEISHLKMVAVTLKIKSRSPKYDQLFTPSQHCICASSV